MSFPLSLSEIGLLLAAMAIILLITSELLFSTEYLGKIVIEKKRLRVMALALGAGFIITVIFRVFQPF